MNRARAHARRWRRWAAAAMAAAATAACTVIGTSPAAYAVTIDPNAWYQIVSRHSGLALGIASSVTTDGARLIQTARRDQASQQFQFVDSGGGYYRLRARHSGKVLDVYEPPPPTAPTSCSGPTWTAPTSSGPVVDTDTAT